MRSLFVLYIVYFSLITPFDLCASDQKLDKKESSLININNWHYWQSNNGISAHNPYTGSAGGIFPNGMVPAIYQDGIIWAGYVLNNLPGKPSLRAGGSYYRTGLEPGWIDESGTEMSPPRPVDPSNPRARIYRIRRHHRYLHDELLREDAASLFNIPKEDVNNFYIDTLRALYERAWVEWPVDLGAPFNDRNGNNT